MCFPQPIPPMQGSERLQEDHIDNPRTGNRFRCRAQSGDSLGLSNHGGVNMLTYDIVRKEVNELASKIEGFLNADVCWYCGPINSAFISLWPKVVESIASQPDKRDTIAIFLTTGGGSAEIAEQAVDIVRHFYPKVFFVVPQFAMSAGTILCLSGDEVFMRYTSCLGPIDPQVEVNGEYVSANGYLDKVSEYIEKSRKNELTSAELQVLLSLDLGKLAKFEQAANLAKDLVKTWLIRHKFSSWTHHKSSGKEVTLSDKENRAEEIVEKLGDNKFWHSHGRRIGMKTLEDILKIQIEDLEEDKSLDELVCSYHQALIDCMEKHKYLAFFHTKKWF